MEKEKSTEKSADNTPVSPKVGDALLSEVLEGEALDVQIHKPRPVTPLESHVVNSSSGQSEVGTPPLLKHEHVKDISFLDVKHEDSPLAISEKENVEDQLETLESLDMDGKASEAGNERALSILDVEWPEKPEVHGGGSEETTKYPEEIPHKETPEPVFNGTEVPPNPMELKRRSLVDEADTNRSIWPEKAVAVKNSLVAVTSFLRRLSGKSDDEHDGPDDERENHSSIKHANEVGRGESEVCVSSPGIIERSGWNPLRLSLMKISLEADIVSNDESGDNRIDAIEPLVMKGRILLYTRLRCLDSREARQFLHKKRLRYVEINIDVYPSRKLELEKLAGSADVPRVFFNEVLIGGLSDLKLLDESGKLTEKIDYVVSEAPSLESPLPPLSGEDDLSSSGSIDELALVVRKMKDSIIVKDRFYRMRRFTNCFLGSEAVDFLSEDQYLERVEAVEFGRKLATKLFFQHVLEENVFEDGSHLYRFLDNDPLISQCQNIPRGIIEAKPKPIVEISSRLRFLFYAILESYTSEDGKHVDYRSIHGSEEFARYLRIIEELQRVELQDMAREEKLAFFINLFNMMAIHAILVWGHPSGTLERRKLFGEFKYVIGGSTFSLSAIYNGILRANQRPPYNLYKPFGTSEKRIKMILPYPEPLVHFALVYGTASGPALRCYSPGEIDKELVEAAQNFIRRQGLLVDYAANVAYASKILKWYSSDFGKNEVEVLKHAANYLEPEHTQATMELLSSSQLKVVYLSYDWRLNH